MKTICINGETIRLMEDDAVRNPICIDCGANTDDIGEQYMIHDDLWRAANPTERGMLCVGCCEKRLGRQLRREDFPPYMLSNVEDGMAISDRLRERVRKD